MEDPGCGPEAWEILSGGLWHATGLKGLLGIIRDGVVRPGQKYKSSFVGARNWVSLFDFGPSATDKSGQFQWKSWFGSAQLDNECCQWENFEQWRDKTYFSAWLEIDREAGASKIVEAEALRLCWGNELDRHTEESSGEIFPSRLFSGVEGAFKGDLPTCLVMRVVFFRSDCSLVADIGTLEDAEKRAKALLAGT